MEKRQITRRVHLSVMLTVLAATMIFATIVSAATTMQHANNPAVRLINLDEAITVAFENSLALRLARLNVEEAQFNLRQAEANNLVSPSPTGLIEARHKAAIAVQQLRLDEFDLRSQVEEAYYSVLRASNLVDIVREALELSTRQLDVAQRKFEVGAETRSDVLSASSAVAEAEANVAQVEGAYDLALLNFKMTLGVDFHTPLSPEPSDFDVTSTTYSLEKDIQFALSHRLELHQLLTAIEATEKQIQLSDNDYTPEIALQGAQLALAKLENQLDQLKKGIQLEIRQAYLGMMDQNRRLPALMKRVEEAEENVRVTTHLYEADMVPLLQVMAVQTALGQAKSDHVHAIFDYNIARSRYDLAVARPLVEDDSK